jgi:transketolase
MAKHGNAVHIGCSFSLIEILAVMYESFLRINWENISDPHRDIIAMSKGHGIMALYACHYKFGWISQNQLEGYFGPANLLKGLSSSRNFGVEVSGGSLGHGFPVTVGMAFAARQKKIESRFFCIAGDGEMNEGSMWESVMFSVQHKLDNLILVIDSNKFQAMGNTNEILNQDNLTEKMNVFGYQAIECNGHNREDVFNSLQKLCNDKNGKPKALIANTVKGKGVSFMENNNAWHYSRLDDDLFKKAIKELENAAKTI